MEFRIYFINAVLAMSLSITAQHQFELCYNLNPIAIQADDFEKEIKSHAYFLKDATRDLKFKDALQSLNNCEFLSEKDIGKLPDEFKSGRYHIWSFFKLSNESDEINKFILSGSIERDSIWVMQNQSDWKGYLISVNEYKKLNPNEKMLGYNRFLLALPARSVAYVFFRQSKIHYNESNVVPKTSSYQNYEKEYIKKVHFITLFYLFSFAFILAILFFNLIYYLYFKWRIIIIYSLYLVTTLFIVYRNYDWSSLYGSFTLGHLLWEDTRLIHTAFIFLSYSYFVVNFLEFKIPYGKNILKVFTFWFVLAIAVDTVSRFVMPEISFSIYYITRMVISLLSLVFIVLIWKSVHRFSKYILFGTIVLITGELASNFFQGYQSSMVVTTCVLIELIIFTIVLGVWSFQTYSAQKNVLQDAEQQVALKNEQLANIRKEFAEDLHDEIGSTVAKLSLETYFLKQQEYLKAERLEGIQKNLNNLAYQIKEMTWLFQEEKNTFTEFQAQIRTFVNEYLVNFEMELTIIMKEPTHNPNVSLDIKRQIMAIIKEVLANIIKHSKANKVNISCSLNDENIVHVFIKDNGVGMNSSPNKSGNGLQNIKHRAEKIGAKIMFISGDGMGINITLKI